MIVKLSEPIKRRNAPIEATMFIAWSAKNSLHENIWRGGCGFVGGVVTTCSSGSDFGWITGAVATFTFSGTFSEEGVATPEATGAFAPTVTGGTAGATNVV